MKPIQGLAGPLVVLFLAAPSFAQSAAKADIFDELRTKAGFTDADIERVESGEAVIKELERTVKREVAVLGIIRLEYTYDIARMGFERTVTTQRRESAREYGRFSGTPIVSDWSGLEFEAGELDDLMECRVGDCEWNLSEKLIRGVADGVDRTSPDARKRASDIIKRGLIEYLDGYRREGSRALMVYRDTDTSVPLAAEYEVLTAEMTLLDRFDKGFADFVRRYPSGRPASATDFFSWSEVKVGFKPVVMITHTMQNEIGGMMLNASKQVFANHYFDSSLGITGLFGYEGGEGRPETYLVFINRSRASALRGRLGGLMRGLIEDQAKGKLEEFLADARKYSALAAANRASAEQREALGESATESPWYLSWTAIAAAALFAAGLAFLLVRRVRG